MECVRKNASSSVEDDVDTREHSADSPLLEHKAAVAFDGGKVPEMVRETNFDTTTLDTATLASEGDEPRWTSKLLAEISYTFTTPSIVSSERENTTPGSEVGVNDHTTKFPDPLASKACTRNTS